MEIRLGHPEHHTHWQNDYNDLPKAAKVIYSVVTKKK